jgi:Cu(I)/Ag(I) efflux system protein CusF
MKRLTTLFFLVLLAGCTAQKEPESAPASAAVSTPPAEPAVQPAPAATVASATGVVQSVDVAAHTITIAHGPVESLKWPGMTMTFQAPGVDVGAFKKGDAVAFDFTSSGMDGTVVSITKQ